MERNELLVQMEKHPQLYIDSRDIFALRYFLAGFLMTKRAENPQEGEWLFDGFRRFLAEQYADD